MIILAFLAMFVFKVDISSLLGGQGPQQNQQRTEPSSVEEKTTEEFIEAIKGSTEDVWAKLIRNYKPPKMVNYDGMTRMSSGGTADARMGPFYVPSEQTIYLDTAFFDTMKQKLGGGGDFAYAYVIAHEVGHHIQRLTGYTDRVHNARGRVSEREYNRLSVRLELQADFLAGVWAHHADQEIRKNDGIGLLEEGDIEEAMAAAKAIGDDALQRAAGRPVKGDTFTHGTSEQRLRWFIKGLRSGNPNEGNTFDIPYERL